MKPYKVYWTNYKKYHDFQYIKFGEIVKQIEIIFCLVFVVWTLFQY